MSTLTFTWKTTAATSGPITLRTRKAQFGDGYSQEVQDGLNNKVGSWSIACVGSKDEMQAVADFLDARGGAESFYWTPPLGVQGYYRCATYTPGYQGGDVYTISGTFQQVFAP